MERIFDSLQRITQLWKKLALAKPDSDEYAAIMDEIRIQSDEYRVLIEVPKNPGKIKMRRACDIVNGQVKSVAGHGCTKICKVRTKYPSAAIVSV